MLFKAKGFGKGTQRKMLAAAKKGARVADKLIDEFGDEKTKRKKNTAKKVASIVSGSGAQGHSPPKKDEQTAGAGGGATEDGQPGCRPFVG